MPAGAGVRAVRPVPAHRQRRATSPTGWPRRSRLLRRPRRAAGRSRRASEDFSDIPRRAGRALHLLVHRRHRPRRLRRAAEAGRVAQDIPVNHSAALRPGRPADPGHRHAGAGRRRAGLARPPDPDLAVHVEEHGLAWRSCPIASRPRPRRTSSSTPTTRSTGGSGAPEAFAEARRRGVPVLLSRRVRRVPLVPRDGARVLRGRGDRGVPQRGVRQRQGRPRGAPRRRRRLHGGDHGDDRPRRLADDGACSTTTASPFFAGTYFPDRAAARAAVASARC